MDPVRARDLRACLAALTDALARGEREDVVLFDLATRTVHVDSTLFDVDQRRPRVARDAWLGVVRPDGLWEWEVRRDFVRSIRVRAREDARKLADTLAGTRTKRRFEIALGQVRERSLLRAFVLHRRIRLRRWVARWLRVVLAGLRPSADLGITPARANKAKATKRRRRGPRKKRSKYVPYVS